MLQPAGITDFQSNHQIYRHLAFIFLVKDFYKIGNLVIRLKKKVQFLFVRALKQAP